MLSALVKAFYALTTYVLVETVLARQSLPLSGAVPPVGRLNVVTRSLVPPAAPLRVAAKPPVLAAASVSPPGRQSRPAPRGGSLVGAYRPGSSGER